MEEERGGVKAAMRLLFQARDRNWVEKWDIYPLSPLSFGKSGEFEPRDVSKP
jgi:hypothetical protein